MSDLPYRSVETIQGDIDRRRVADERRAETARQEALCDAQEANNPRPGKSVSIGETTALFAILNTTARAKDADGFPVPVDPYCREDCASLSRLGYADTMNEAAGVYRLTLAGRRKIARIRRDLYGDDYR